MAYWPISAIRMRAKTPPNARSTPGSRWSKPSSKLRDDMAQGRCSARVGIASGLVLIGDLVAAGAAHAHDVVGETPNLAARLQTNAEPNTVIISGETRRLVGELFECAAVDAQPLKGFAMPMESWRVVKRSEIVNRFQGAALRRTRCSSVESRRPISWWGAGRAPKRETAASC